MGSCCSMGINLLFRKMNNPRDILYILPIVNDTCCTMKILLKGEISGCLGSASNSWFRLRL